MTTLHPYRYARVGDPMNGLGRGRGGEHVVTAEGLSLDADGMIRLALVPTSASRLAETDLGELEGPAGIGVGPDGTVYVSDPAGGRVLAIDCAGCVQPFGCAESDSPASSPRGLAVGPRRSLYVADAARQCVLVLDLATATVRAVWRGFAEPWDVAADSAGGVYVVDHGRDELVRLDADGRRDDEFGRALAANARRPAEPRAIAVLAPPTRSAGDPCSPQTAERLLVIDGGGGAGPTRLVVLGLDGVEDRAAGDALSNLLGARLDAVTATAGVVYVSGPSGVLAFDLDGGFRGVVDAAGVAVALAVDEQGRLLVHGPGGVDRLATTGRIGFGRLVVRVPDPDVAGPWDEVRLVLGEPLPAGARIRLYTRSSASAAPPPPPGSGSQSSVREDPPSASVPSPVDTWRAAPPGALATHCLVTAERHLFVAIELQGDGTSTPALEAVRVEVTGRGLRSLLPATYGRSAVADDALGRFLALVSSVHQELDDAFDDMRALLDSEAAPDRAHAPWLELLASWVAADLPPGAGEAARRAAISSAFDAHGRRGTLAGMREALAATVSSPVSITEPAAHLSLWALGQASTSTLGASTGLVPWIPDAAALDTTALIDRSALVGANGAGPGSGGYGTALFAAVAHRFCVHVHRADVVDAAALTQIEAVVQREKPVHTIHRVCVLEPNTRVGFQSTVGVDMVIGAGPRPLRLRESAAFAASSAGLLGRGDDAIGPNRSPTTSIGGQVGVSTAVGSVGRSSSSHPISHSMTSRSHHG